MITDNQQNLLQCSENWQLIQINSTNISELKNQTFISTLIQDKIYLFSKTEKQFTRPLYQINLEFSYLKNLLEQNKSTNENDKSYFTIQREQQYLEIIFIQDTESLKFQQQLLGQWFRQLKSQCTNQNIRENYDITSQIGQGSYSTVFICVPKQNPCQKFAVKVINKTLYADLTLRQQLLTEIQIQRRLRESFNILRIYEVYESKRNLYIILQYQHGGNLKELTLKKLSEKVIYQLIEQILESLEYMHSLNVIHRDLKPENILLNKRNLNTLNFQIAIADFGFSIYKDERLLEKSRCGTPGYVAPEILKTIEYNEKVDIFSTGIIFYNLVTGENLIKGKSLNEVLIKTLKSDFQGKIQLKIEDADLRDLILRMTYKNPILRPSASQALESKYIQSRKTKNNKQQYIDGSNPNIDQLVSTANHAQANQQKNQIQRQENSNLPRSYSPMKRNKLLINTIDDTQPNFQVINKKQSSFKVENRMKLFAKNNEQKQCFEQKQNFSPNNHSQMNYNFLDKTISQATVLQDKSPCKIQNAFKIDSKLPQYISFQDFNNQIQQNDCIKIQTPIDDEKKKQFELKQQNKEEEFSSSYFVENSQSIEYNIIECELKQIQTIDENLTSRLLIHKNVTRKFRTFIDVNHNQ
ncbi:protein kinase domain containing protein [Stylonychia lemnae]|uniref:Protein kinase domain containing protein n=1 Tax=Stylonychia lemnae TaxID=5949 RepID=A0A078AK24_STYLE|nr:protein kinase domain containing protein [Stylonychia lemnae]|eukprot:CDW82251.1 protein kinase domain containing protein [Stylonychia lemnae]